MASIDKRGKGYRVRWRDPSGDARSRQCPTLSSAKRLARAVEEAGAEGRRWEPRDARQVPTLDVVLAAYIRDAVRVYRPSTADAYARALDVFLQFLRREYGSTRPLLPDLLSKDLLARWFDDLTTSGRHGKTRKLSSKKKFIQTLTRAWEWAYEEDEFADFIPRPRHLRMPTGDALPTRAPTWEEMDACIHAATGVHRELAVLLRFTGLRVQQAMGLLWTDFDLDEATLTIRGELGKSKQERKGRIIPISPHLVAELERWPKAEPTVVGSNRKAGKYERIARQRDMARAWARAGVKEEVWKGQSHHAFRKGFVSELKRSGADADAVEHLVGHSLGLRGVYTDPRALPLVGAVRLLPESQALA